MTPPRRGIALLVALIVVLVLAGLASSALATARVALVRAGEAQGALQSELTRDAIRARAMARADVAPAAAWSAAPWVLAAPDTTLRSRDLGGGWYRWSAEVGGRTVVAELARVTPWSAPTADSVLVLSAVEFDSLWEAWTAELIPRVAPESLVLQGTIAAGVYRASGYVRLDTGAEVEGIVLAPEVRLEAGALVRGVVITRQAMAVGPGARVASDPLAAAAGWSMAARLHLLGRRGLLAPP